MYMCFELVKAKTRNFIFNPFPNKPWFLRIYSASLLKTLWEKEKLLIMSNLSFSHCVFYPFGKLFTIFIKFRIVDCKLSVWKGLKFVVWKGVNFISFLKHKIRAIFEPDYMCSVFTFVQYI